MPTDAGFGFRFPNYPVNPAYSHGQTADVPDKCFSLVHESPEALAYFKEVADGIEIRVPVTILPTPVWEAHLAPVVEKTLTQKPKGGFEFL